MSSHNSIPINFVFFLLFLQIISCGSNGNPTTNTEVKDTDSDPIQVGGALESEADNQLPVLRYFSHNTEIYREEEFWLDATESTDGDDDVLELAWSLRILTDGTTVAQGSTFDLTIQFSDMPTGNYRLDLVLSDGIDAIENNPVFFTVYDTYRPFDISFADRQYDISREIKYSINSVPMGLLGGSLEYRWDLVDKPDESKLSLSDFTGRTINFHADIAGEYILSVYAVSGLQRTEAVNAKFTVSAENYLPGIPIEALYSAAIDRILVATRSPNRLLIVDPDNSGYTEIELDLVPTALALSPSSNMAVIAHDAWVSLVDLNAESVEKVILSGINGFDVEYISPESVALTSAESNMSTVDLTTGDVSDTVYMQAYSHPKIQVMPEFNYLYAVSDGSDLEKYQIDGLGVSFTYSNTNWEYTACGDLWLNHDADKLITECGVIYQIGETQESDMLYAGKVRLQDGQRISGIYNDFEQKQIWVLANDRDQNKIYNELEDVVNNSQIRTVSDTYFSLIDSYELPVTGWHTGYNDDDYQIYPYKSMLFFKDKHQSRKFALIYVGTLNDGSVDADNVAYRLWELTK